MSPLARLVQRGRAQPVVALCLIGALGCGGSLLFAIYFLEGHLQLDPCPLCILDRFAIASAGAGFLLAAPIHGSFWAWAALAWAGISLLAGAVVGIRHVWVQWYPPESANCLFFAADSGPLAFVIDAFAGTADCSFVDWTFLGLSIAEQTLLLYMGLMLLLIWAAKKRFSRRSL